MHLPQMGVGYMRVDLGGRNIAVAEQGLDATQVSAVHEQVSGKRMAQRVRRHLLSYASQPGVVTDNALDAAGR